MKNNYPRVSIITVNFNGKKYLKKLLDSVFSLNYPKDKVEVIFVDNVSTDNSVEFVKKNYRKVKIIKNDVNNYCRALNLGIEKAQAEYVALINNDIRLDKSWLIELVKVITKEKKVACAGSKVLNMTGKIQNAGHYELPNFYWGERGAGQERKKYNVVEEVPSLCGASVLYRKKAILEAGLFDEDFVIFGEDVDMSFRLRQKGYKLIFVPSSIAHHKFHGTANKEFSRYQIERNRLLFLAKYYPHKLSSSLLGSGYFTAESSVDSCAKIYHVLPEIIMKLVSTHPIDIINEVVSELFGEISKIINYENDFLAKEINKITEDRNKTYEIRNQILNELQRKNEEVADKDERLAEEGAKVNQLQQENQSCLDRLQAQEKELNSCLASLQDKEKELNSCLDRLQAQEKELNSCLASLQDKEKELTAYKDELINLSGQLRSRMNEVLSKGGEIIDRKIEIDALKNELSGLAEQLANSVVDIEETKIQLQDKEKELTAHRNELDILSAHLRSRMDEVLIKDGQLVEKDFQNSQLQEEIQKHLNTIQDKEGVIQDKENLLVSRNGEIANLNNNIHQFQQEIQKHLNTIQDKEGVIQDKEGVIQDKENLLVSRNGEISSLKNELSGIYNSEGFRFILRPLWRTLWNVRGSIKIITMGIKQAVWFMTAIALTPFFLFLGLSLLVEHMAWVILGPILKMVTPKRKIESIKDSRVSLVIPNYNGIAYLGECLPSVFSADGFTDGQNEVLVVDDGSTDGSVDFIRSNFPAVRIIENKKNKGFGFTCNRGIKAAKNEVIVLINNDIILTKDFLKPLITHLEDESVFAVTPKLYAWDKKTFAWGMHMGHFEEGYIRLWNESETGNGDRVNHTSPTLFAIGGAMLFRKRDFIWLGGFDGIYRPNCWEDIDISYQAWKRGLKVIYEPASLMYHKGRATLTYERSKEIKNELLFTWKNITDARILKNHLNLLPWNLYRNRMAFFKGFFWALNYIPQAMFNRLLSRSFIVEPTDQKIFNKVMLHYQNFSKRGFKDAPQEKPNVLIVSRFLPYPLNAGGKIRIHALAKLLSDRYNFILLSLFDHENELQYIPRLKEVFSEVYPVFAKSPWSIDFTSEPFYPDLYKTGYSYNEDLIDKLKEIESKKPIDIVHIESNELLYLVDHLEYTPVVYTEHDISILSLSESYYKKKNLFSFFDHLKKIYFHTSQFKKIDKAITLSREDRKVLEEFFPETETNFIPTGVDLKHFSLNTNHRKTNKLVFVGHYRHYPNEDAMVYFVNKVFPLVRKSVPEVELLLVGSDPTEAIKKISKKKNVTLIGAVDDVKPYLDQADVFVNYIRKGAGIKGKVLEAMAAGVPVVSTKTGSSGINAKSEQEILLAENPKEFARQVIRLLKDEKLRKKIISSARVLVENEYDWIKIKDKLDRLYRSILFDTLEKDPDAPAIERIIDNANSFVEQKIKGLNSDLIKPQEGPDELHIELTYNCNSKCIMCDLWDYNSRSPRKGCPELSLGEIKRFVENSRLLHNLKTVVLSGGEPFLRNDLVDLCGFFSGNLPDAAIGILTNGLATETILAKGKEILDRFSPKSLWLGSSLDGIGKGHDRIRGVEGSFSALQKTIGRCKKELPGVNLSLTFTLTPYNVDQLIPAKEFADGEGINFFAQFVVPKEAREEFVWTPKNLNLAEDKIAQVIRGIINKADKQALLNSIDRIKDKNVISNLYYWSHLLRYQTNPQRFFKKCVSGGRFAMFDPYGDLFFCPTHKSSFIGNIKDESFDNLWMSQKAQHMRSFIKEGNCHCWLVCIVFPVLEKALNN